MSKYTNNTEDLTYIAGGLLKKAQFEKQADITQMYKMLKGMASSFVGKVGGKVGATGGQIGSDVKDFAKSVLTGQPSGIGNKLKTKAVDAAAKHLNISLPKEVGAGRFKAKVTSEDYRNLQANFGGLIDSVVGGTAKKVNGAVKGVANAGVDGFTNAAKADAAAQGGKLWQGLKTRVGIGNKAQVTQFGDEINSTGQGISRYLGGSRAKAMDAAKGNRTLTGDALTQYNDEMNKVLGARVAAGGGAFLGANMLLNSRR